MFWLKFVLNFVRSDWKKAIWVAQDLQIDVKAFRKIDWLKFLLRFMRVCMLVGEWLKVFRTGTTQNYIINIIKYFFFNFLEFT